MTSFPCATTFDLENAVVVSMKSGDQAVMKFGDISTGGKSVRHIAIRAKVEHITTWNDGNIALKLGLKGDVLAKFKQLDAAMAQAHVDLQLVGEYKSMFYNNGESIDGKHRKPDHNSCPVKKMDALNNQTDLGGLPDCLGQIEGKNVVAFAEMSLWKYKQSATNVNVTLKSICVMPDGPDQDEHEDAFDFSAFGKPDLEAEGAGDAEDTEEGEIVEASKSKKRARGATAQTAQTAAKKARN